MRDALSNLLFIALKTVKDKPFNYVCRRRIILLFSEEILHKSESLENGFLLTYYNKEEIPSIPVFRRRSLYSLGEQ